MKQKKMMKAFFTCALALILSMGSLTTVFAAPGPISGNEADPAQAVITKELQMPAGTTTPGETFTFAFAKKDVDGDNSTAAKGTMPAFSAKTAAIAAGAAGTTDASGVKTVTAETASLLPDTAWPHAGVYTYTVTETAGSTTGMTYSQAAYDISFYVANGSSGLYVAAIGTTIELKDDGTSGGSTKTDPSTPSTTVTGAYSAMVFTNQYVKKNGGTDPIVPADRTLAISKNVAGDYADQTKYFEYNVTVTKSALTAAGTTYKGYVVENGAVVTAAANYAGTIGTDANGGYIDFTTGTAVTVNLKHGQTLAFVDNEVGSSYTAVESAVADYTAGYSIVVNGGTPITYTNASANTALSTDDTVNGARLIGENANTAAFTNTYKTVTPTGISLNNLPFIMMIVLAAAALAGFVAVKARKKTYSN